MQIFLDSVDMAEISKYQSMGFIDGVTTNPSLMSKADIKDNHDKQDCFYSLVKNISELVSGDVSIEAPSLEYEEMLKQGDKILKIGANIVLKLPCTENGIRACKYFSDRNHKVNMTLCFSANQALLAARAGATYISPFIGRLEDIGEDGIGLISDIRDIYDNFKFKTKILAASVRNIEHVNDSALLGADVVTMTGEVLSQLIKHELTDKGLKKFEADWSNSGLKI